MQEPNSPAKSPSQTILPSSPRFFSSSPTSAAASTQRRIAIAVDLSDESAYAVKWAVQNYIRPGDVVILLHVRPTSVLYGADWGPLKSSEKISEETQQKLEDDFDVFTTTKAEALAQPLVDGNIPFKIHIVKDHDMKERLCLEVERLGLSAVIMGSRGVGAVRRGGKSRLGSVSDYCVHHCVCPVMVVRYPDEMVPENVENDAGKVQEEVDLKPVPEEEQEYHDADEEHKVHRRMEQDLYNELEHAERERAEQEARLGNVKCRCEIYAPIIVCERRENAGRRFFGCSNHPFGCRYFDWIDPPLCLRATEYIFELQAEIRRLRSIIQGITNLVL